MAEFYVTKTPTDAAAHKLHRNDCKELPAVDSLLYLGSYATRDAAYKLAIGYYNQVEDCPSCFPAA